MHASTQSFSQGRDRVLSRRYTRSGRCGLIGPAKSSRGEWLQRRRNRAAGDRRRVVDVEPRAIWQGRLPAPAVLRRRGRSLSRTLLSPTI